MADVLTLTVSGSLAGFTQSTKYAQSNRTSPTFATSTRAELM
jgi:hypothetical protein